MSSQILDRLTDNSPGIVSHFKISSKFNDWSDKTEGLLLFGSAFPLLFFVSLSFKYSVSFLVSPVSGTST